MESIGMCKYKDIFGRPNEGVHSYRLFNIAIIDVILTIIAAVLLSWFFNISIWKSIICLFLIGIFFHRLFCVRTTIDKLLFL